MKNVYFISGLGADARAFSLLDLSFCNPLFVAWLKPLPNETLESYARRLRNSIPEESPTVVGISFGGMLASEMTKADPKVKAIIISANKTAAEFPKYLRASRYFPLYKWLPNRVLKQFIFSVKKLFGQNEQRQKQIILDIIRDTDVDFVKWSINAILHWNNHTPPVNLVHIHGTGDRILPYRYVKADYTIRSQSHVLPLDHHVEVSRLLKMLIVGDERGDGSRTLIT